MQLHSLKARTKRVLSKQVGRGGTRGKTAGRGTKGQNARAGHKNRPELRDFIKRFPKLRGRGVSPFKSIQKKPFVLNLGFIDKAYKANDTVSKRTLLENKIISAKTSAGFDIKILGTGEITKALSFEGVIVSASAREKITKAGGNIKE
jgi:large subunit ribosomal protein L15